MGTLSKARSSLASKNRLSFPVSCRPLAFRIESISPCVTSPLSVRSDAELDKAGRSAKSAELTGGARAIRLALAVLPLRLRLRERLIRPVLLVTLRLLIAPGVLVCAGPDSGTSSGTMSRASSFSFSFSFVLSWLCCCPKSVGWSLSPCSTSCAYSGVMGDAGEGRCGSAFFSSASFKRPFSSVSGVTAAVAADESEATALC